MVQKWNKGEISTNLPPLAPTPELLTTITPGFQTDCDPILFYNHLTTMSWLKHDLDRYQHVFNTELKGSNGTTLSLLTLVFGLLQTVRPLLGSCPQTAQQVGDWCTAAGAARATAFAIHLDGDLLFCCALLGRLLTRPLSSTLQGSENHGPRLDIQSGLSGWQLPKEIIRLITIAASDTIAARNRQEQVLLFGARSADLCYTIPPATIRFLKLEKAAAQLSLSQEEIPNHFESVQDMRHSAYTLYDIPHPARHSYLELKCIDDGEKSIDFDRSPQVTILAVDDDPMTLLTLETMLKSEHRRILTAADGDQALQLALRENPHMLITDWRMPGLDGIRLCRVLRKTLVTRDIYIVMLTGNETDKQLVEAFNAGADDYVVKPFTPEVLLARICSGERLIFHQRTIRKDREVIRQYADQLAAANRKLQDIAMTDFLTGLSNRRSAIIRLKKLVAEARRYGEPLSCLMLDIDHFKRINDTYGHDCGDIVLKELSWLFKEKARSYDTVSRWGGEEFLIISARSGPEDSFQLAERLRLTVENHPVAFPDGTVVSLTISIGVATWGQEHLNEDSLIKEADTCLYKAKQSGRNRVISSLSDSHSQSEESS